MSVAIVGKLLGGLVVSGGGIATITYMVINSPSYVELDKKDSKNNIYIYAISKKVVSESSEPAKDNITNSKEYKCKFDSKYYECELSTIEDFDSTTKQIDITKLINTSTAIQTIKKDTLKTTDTIYRILINSKIDNWTKTTEDNNKFSIEIIPKTPETGQSTKYASLKPLFAIKSDGLSDKYTKTKYFVVQNKVSPASTSVAGAAASTPAHKCSTSATINGNVIWTEDESCDVYDFSNDTNIKDKILHTLVFTKIETPTADTSLSIANKHYLVQLKTSVKVSEVKQIKITTSGSTDSFQSKEIIPAIQITEKTDSIFILQTKKSVQENSKTK